MNKDIYFSYSYAKLNETIENGTAKIFEINNENGYLTHTFIQREIPYTIDGIKYYDLITPYGYGGPIIHEANNKLALINDFKNDFSLFCQENNIISEFVRFHPLYQNNIDFQSVYNSTYLRNTIGTNLIDFEDPFQTEFSKSTRKTIRKILRDHEISYYIDDKVESLEDFKEIYYSTMDRNNASDFYYFDDKYFNTLIDNFLDKFITVNVLLKDKKIAMGLYFISEGNIHVHLSGTLTDYLDYSPAYILKYATVEWGKNQGYRVIHYGGGTSSDANDSLYKFKKKFGKETEFEFYIGKKVWNNDKYLKICKEANTSPNSNFFPAYRER